jgi:hypothetical protein
MSRSIASPASRRRRLRLPRNCSASFAGLLLASPSAAFPSPAG